MAHILVIHICITYLINQTNLNHFRPTSLRNLYEKATTDRLSTSLLDQLRRDSQHSPYLLCTPVLSSKRRKIYQKVDVDIETHIVSVIDITKIVLLTIVITIILLTIILRSRQ